MLSTHSTFLHTTAHQRPDHILKTLPAPPTTWVWLTPPVKYLLSVTAPVLVAVLVYVMYESLQTQHTIAIQMW